MRVVIAAFSMAFMILSSCTKEVLVPDDLSMNQSQSLFGSSVMEGSANSGKDYFTSFGGKWEVVWVKEGIPELEREYSLPFQELREESLGPIPCGNGTSIDTTITYFDTYKSHEFTFTNNENMEERSSSIDLDPVYELSNCHNIHYKHTEYHVKNDGTWNYDPQTNLLTWLINSGSDNLYTFFNKYEGSFEKINDNEFWFTGILSSYAEENGIPGGITTLPYKYRIKRFSERK